MSDSVREAFEAHFSGKIRFQDFDFRYGRYVAKQPYVFGTDFQADRANTLLEGFKAALSANNTGTGSEFKKGDDYPPENVGDNWLAGIHVNEPDYQHGNRIEVWGETETHAKSLRDHILRALSANGGEAVEQAIDEAIESGGWWASCSGCHETNEGVSDGPRSIFGCHAGIGCDECGGIGVIWHEAPTDEQIALLSSDPDTQPAPPSVAVPEGFCLERGHRLHHARTGEVCSCPKYIRHPHCDRAEMDDTLPIANPWLTAAPSPDHIADANKMVTRAGDMTMPHLFPAGSVDVNGEPISDAGKMVPDEFNGDNEHLVQCINSLLAMDAQGVMAPHGIGGHARTLLSSAASRLSGTPSPDHIADAGKVAKEWPAADDNMTAYLQEKAKAAGYKPDDLDARLAHFAGLVIADATPSVPENEIKARAVEQAFAQLASEYAPHGLRKNYTAFDVSQHIEAQGKVYAARLRTAGDEGEGETHG